MRLGSEDIIHCIHQLGAVLPQPNNILCTDLELLLEVRFRLQKTTAATAWKFVAGSSVAWKFAEEVSLLVLDFQGNTSTHIYIYLHHLRLSALSGTVLCHFDFCTSTFDTKNSKQSNSQRKLRVLSLQREWSWIDWTASKPKAVSKRL